MIYDLVKLYINFACAQIVLRLFMNYGSSFKMSWWGWFIFLISGSTNSSMLIFDKFMLDYSFLLKCYFMGFFYLYDPASWTELESIISWISIFSHLVIMPYDRPIIAFSGVNLSWEIPFTRVLWNNFWILLRLRVTT